MTNTEIDTLAREILAETILQLADSKPEYEPLFCEVSETDEGELIPAFSASSAEGFGSFFCEYMPLEAIKKIIADCETAFDSFTVQVTLGDTGQPLPFKVSDHHLPESRSESIRWMAEIAATHLIGSFKSRLCDLLEEVVEDSNLLAEGLLASVVAGVFNSPDFMVGKYPVAKTPMADGREEIEKSIKKVADKKRDLLVSQLKLMPNLLVERRAGRPKGTTKPAKKKANEAEIFEREVEEAIRSLIAATGETPTKTAVAKSLKIGGVNSAKGTDTSLPTFITKLRRHKLDYNLIVEKAKVNR